MFSPALLFCSLLQLLVSHNNRRGRKFVALYEVDETSQDWVEAAPDALPEGLRRAYFRVGPNPVFFNVDDDCYHWFDGDGMLHVVNMGADKITYSSNYVNTYRYKKEDAAGHPIFLRVRFLQTERLWTVRVFTVNNPHQHSVNTTCYSPGCQLQLLLLSTCLNACCLYCAACSCWGT
jgi:carotenoid cleavage dioxygenase-like enzyme